MTWFKAQLFLIWAAIKLFAQRFLFFRRSGYKRFVQNYVSEGASPMTVAWRSIASEATNCIGCGLCDTVCPPYLQGKDNFRGPSYWVSNLLRDTHLIEKNQTQGALSVCKNCEKCQSLCPSKIQIPKLIDAFIQIG